ncbi:hypothetical protein [Clostridium beijerinckii]|uniref:hypothetical protein n=1 Tax=Clostridium beijerinckii TaxID=1520 RepID=UPI00098C2DAD|nr:hypothetical protein [Clostridium beijerinckii]NRT80231.1 hypothetical protein [Clostridium beijerinckii]OOM48697.1 hypothetical protein CBEIJ_20140 [Clostridium beijerinckii]
MKKDEEDQKYSAEHNKKMDDSDFLPSIEFLENIACEYNSDGTERNFDEKLEACRREKYRSADVSAITGESVHIDSEKLDRVPEGRFDTEIDGAHFECFYQASEYNYLYVVLDTMRDDKTIAKGPLPRFHKWSWSTFLKGHLLSIEDPMYFESDISVGWFYGTKERDYRDATAKLVMRVAKRLCIPNEHIIFYSVSSGGTSGLFTAEKISGSVAIASNPQLDLTRFIPSALANFKECTGIDLAYEKEYGDAGRVDFAHVLSRNSLSKYLVIINCRSKIDFNDQLIPFCKELGITPHYGLQKVGNLIIWVIDAPGPHPHLYYESKTMYFAIDFLAKTFAEGGDIDRLKSLYIMFSEFWHEKAGLIAGDPECLADADPVGKSFAEQLKR